MDELGHVGWDWRCPCCKSIFHDTRMTKQAARAHLQACRSRSEADREVFRKTYRWPRRR